MTELLNKSLGFNVAAQTLKESHGTVNHDGLSLLIVWPQSAQLTMKTSSTKKLLHSLYKLREGFFKFSNHFSPS